MGFKSGISFAGWGVESGSLIGGCCGMKGKVASALQKHLQHRPQGHLLRFLTYWDFHSKFHKSVVFAVCIIAILMYKVAFFVLHIYPIVGVSHVILSLSDLLRCTTSTHIIILLMDEPPSL